MKKARIRVWLSGWGSHRGILEHALGEGVIKCITVIHLICRCLGGGYGNSRGRQGRLRRMLLAGRVLDCGRCARPPANGKVPGCVSRPSNRPGIMPLVPLLPLMRLAPLISYLTRIGKMPPLPLEGSIKMKPDGHMTTYSSLGGFTQTLRKARCAGSGSFLQAMPLTSSIPSSLKSWKGQRPSG